MDPRAAGTVPGTSSRPRNSGAQRTLGPVANLERHLPAEWWRTLFNSIYLKTDGDVVENDENTRREVDLLVRATGLRPGDPILDLCCGQGRHSLELARRGYHPVIGQDRSRYLVRLARRRARSESLDVQFREGDARKFRLPEGSLECVAVLGNSFGYFDHEEDDRLVLRSALRVLRGRGHLVLDLTDGAWMRDHFEPRSWEWIDTQHLVCRERSLDETGRRIISREVVVHSENGIIADQFYAERLYTRDQITELLASEGFTEIEHLEIGDTRSTRGQDLGMMEHRCFIHARAPEKPTTVPSRATTHVTVLLGDPSLPDDIKLTGSFGDEDHATIDKLKEALAQLPGYEFEYLDRHDEYIERLRRSRPDLVLNLCDEGYRNDANLELHVPALLQILDLPHTGAGPQCLSACYDKGLVRALAIGLDIAVPEETYFHPADDGATIPGAFPALVKPNTGDSSIGITMDSVVYDPETLVRRLGELREELPGRSFLIQEFLAGDEYSVGVVGNPGGTVHILPILQVDYSGLPDDLPKILGYESKWDPRSPYWTGLRYAEADLDHERQRAMVDASMMLFERLGCRDYARFDFRCDAAGVPKLLETNPNPGWCWDGKLNLMAELEGWTYSEFLGRILSAATERLGVTRAGTA